MTYIVEAFELGVGTHLELEDLTVDELKFKIEEAKEKASKEKKNIVYKVKDGIYRVGYSTEIEGKIIEINPIDEKDTNVVKKRKNKNYFKRATGKKSSVVVKEMPVDELWNLSNVEVYILYTAGILVKIPV